MPDNSNVDSHPESPEIEENAISAALTDKAMGEPITKDEMLKLEILHICQLAVNELMDYRKSMSLAVSKLDLSIDRVREIQKKGDRVKK